MFFVEKLCPAIAAVRSLKRNHRQVRRFIFARHVSCFKQGRRVKQRMAALLLFNSIYICEKENVLKQVKIDGYNLK